jgi:hypothetical protein
MVSAIKTIEDLLPILENYLNKGRYAKVTEAIGMHSVLADPLHTLETQKDLYSRVLAMLKNRISGNLGKRYGAWYADFPRILDGIITAKNVVTDDAAAQILTSHRTAYGPFKSPEDFFFWALDDRRLPLDQIVKYLEKTADPASR